MVSKSFRLSNPSSVLLGDLANNKLRINILPTDRARHLSVARQDPKRLGPTLTDHVATKPFRFNMRLLLRLSQLANKNIRINTLAG